MLRGRRKQKTAREEKPERTSVSEREREGGIQIEKRHKRH